MTATLNDLISVFRLVKLQVTLRLDQATTLPDFKGALWHGWFGHVLKGHDEYIYHVCYGEHDQQQPKPYLICPNNDHKTDWKKGELIDFELCLFGSAVQLAPQIICAIESASKKSSLGLGCDRARFSVVSIASLTPWGRLAGVHICTLGEWLEKKYCSSYISNEIALTLMTPVRLKQQGRVIKHNPPMLSFWVNQILRRIIQISRFWIMDKPELFALAYKECERCIPIDNTVHADCYFENWQRYSLKQQKQLPFGGLKGQISFYGDINALLPIFQIGELIHIGGKTTFGLGKYQLIQ